MDSQIIWSPGMTLESVEKQVILMAYRVFKGNKTQTAQALGISVRTLDKKLADYKVDSDKEQKREEHEQQERAAYLKRARGSYTGYNAEESSPNAATNHAHESGSGLHMEPAANTPEKPTVPVSERKEVQGMSPTVLASSGPARSR